MEKSGDIMIFSHVGYPTMVLTTTKQAKRCSKDSTTTIGHSANARREGNGTAPSQENDVDGLQIIQAIPLNTRNFKTSFRHNITILEQGIWKRYASYIMQTVDQVLS